MKQTGVVALIAIGLGVSAAARADWIPNGNPLINGEATSRGAEIAVDAWGQSYVVGVASGGARVFKLNPSGSFARRWPSEGVLLPGSSLVHDIAADGLGGAYVMVVASGEPEAPPDREYVLRLHHLDAAGRSPSGWPSAGLALQEMSGREAFFLGRARIVSDNLTCVAAWVGNPRNGSYVLHAQRLAYFGRRLWGPAGVTVASSARELGGVQLAAQDREAWIVWTDGRETEDADIFVTRLDRFGAPIASFGTGGRLVTDAPGTQNAPSIDRDGERGLLIAWRDERRHPGQPFEADVFATHLDATGSTVSGWTPGGDPAGVGEFVQFRAVIVSDRRGGAWVAWMDNRPETMGYDIWYQRFDRRGEQAFGDSGRALVTAPGWQEELQIAADRDGGFVLTWDDTRRDYFNIDCYALRVARSGAPADGWPVTGMPLTTAVGNQFGPRLAATPSGFAVAVWPSTLSNVEPSTYSVLVTRVPRTPGDATAERLEALALEARAIEGEAAVTDEEATADVAAASTLTTSLRAYVQSGSAVRVQFVLPAAGEVTASLFDVNGRRVAAGAARSYGAGSHELAIPLGSQLANGVYFVRLQSATGSQSRLVRLVR